MDPPNHKLKPSPHFLRLLSSKTVPEDPPSTAQTPEALLEAKEAELQKLKQANKRLQSEANDAYLNTANDVSYYNYLLRERDQRIQKLLEENLKNSEVEQLKDELQKQEKKYLEVKKSEEALREEAKEFHWKMFLMKSEHQKELQMKDSEILKLKEAASTFDDQLVGKDQKVTELEEQLKKFQEAANREAELKKAEKAKDDYFDELLQMKDRENMELQKQLQKVVSEGAELKRQLEKAMEKIRELKEAETSDEEEESDGSLYSDSGSDCDEILKI
ncbi:hypothetical protein CRE_01268 [Caenorhabditis remanei]|uniref:Uncharacterized protein n=1 Tax=Caenorhabditis remanei TaxID=31234 RepID=E3N9P3_CAERE|nr:hypothetical protein CRE_01268 [Caenorhabditis remanei]